MNYAKVIGALKEALASTLGDHDTGDDDGGDGRDVEENQTRESILGEDALVGDTNMDMDLFGILQAACSDPPKKRKPKKQKTTGQTEQSVMLGPENCNGDDDLFEDSSVFSFLGAEELQAFRQVRNLCQSCPSSKLSEWAPELCGNVCSEDNNEVANDGGESTDGSDDWEATILENASDQPSVSSSSSASGSKPTSDQTGIGEGGKQEHVACPFSNALQYQYFFCFGGGYGKHMKLA